ncbi:amidase signature enzyme [Peniophora sp. CONT]|nr:amidase signature enzyme [Peniophora sp. CONT]
MWPFSSRNPAVEAKLAARDTVLSTAHDFSEAEHQSFLNATATEIVRRIEKGEWTASTVLEAYIARAAQAQEQTLCLTEVFFEQARADAKQLDEEFERTKKLRGPLHGVPLSLKDMFQVTGVDNSIGFTTWINKPAEDDALIVKILKGAGAVPFVKTNIPQTLLAFECSNPLWGRALNPWNAAYTPGGSSGGEAALLAMDGSALGIGTDIGGSLRIPAHYCGIYSLKPGFGRSSTDGTIGPDPGFEAIRAVNGPMGRSVEDLTIVARLLFGQRDSNYYPAPVPFRDIKLPKKVRFGFYTSDDFIKASPVCKRAVLETVEALRLEGHECVEFKLPKPGYRALSLFTAITSADGYEGLLRHLGPDPKESAMFLITLGPKLPGFIRSFAAWAISFYDPIFAHLLTQSRHKTVLELKDYVTQKLEYERDYRRLAWAENKFDAIIAPVQAIPAVPHHGCDNLSPLAASTAQFNIVDSPVGIVPVTRVDPAKDVVTDEWFIGDDRGSKIWEGALYGKNAVYDPVKMEGLPVGVQIVGPPWGEEAVLAIMDVVDKALGPRGFGPGSWKLGDQKSH